MLKGVLCVSLIHLIGLKPSLKASDILFFEYWVISRPLHFKGPLSEKAPIPVYRTGFDYYLDNIILVDF